jgi:hypothetical protein
MSDAPAPIPAPAKPTKHGRRWRFQYSLRSLLIFVTVVGVLCGWLGRFILRVQHQRSVVTQIKALGGRVNYDYQVAGMRDRSHSPPPPGPGFIRWIFGDDVFANVEAVLFSSEHQLKDEDVAILKELPHLKYVSLYGPGITDNGIEVVCHVPEIQALQIDRTGVTDAAISFIGRLPQLRFLDLWQNQGVTDISAVGEMTNLESFQFIGNSSAERGFARLKALRKLKRLQIYSPALGDDEMGMLDDLQELTFLNLYSTRLTDSGLIHLKGLTRLQLLDLSNIQGITDQGLVCIEPLTNLEILMLSGTNVTSTGIARLKRLTRLRDLRVGPKVTKDELSALRCALPACTFEIVAPNGLIETLQPGQKE